MPAFIRKSIRLPFSQIYNSSNSFFVTICVEGKVEIFDINLKGKIISNNNSGDTVVASTSVKNLNKNRIVASTEITKLCQKSLLNLYEIYENIELGDWVIMPNHIHFILTFLDVPKSKFTGKESDLGSIIKSFKLHFQKSVVEATTVSPFLEVYFREENFNYHKIWQKSFYDHVIRNEKDLDTIREYIYNNPLQWELDSLNPRNSG